jgi:hypothetical protein
MTDEINFSDKKTFTDKYTDYHNQQESKLTSEVSGIPSRPADFDLSEKIELWKLQFGISMSQSPKFRELDKIIKEFIRLLKEDLKLQLNDSDLLWCYIRIDKLAGWKN